MYLYVMPSKRKLLIISIFCIFYSNHLLAQKTIFGKWVGQRELNSCWAASLSNLTRCDSNKTISVKDEQYFYRRYKADIPYDEIENTFMRIATYTFKFREALYDSILNFSSFQTCFSYKFSRPVIYSYGYRDDLNGHFVNIYGTITTNIADNSHNRWLKVFDPKPNSTGSIYLKNYKTYQIVDETQSSLQTTFYQFVANRFKLPSEIPNAKQPSISPESLQSQDCISQNSLKASINRIISVPEFKSIVGDSITFVNDSIPISNLTIDKRNRSETRFIAVESVNTSFIIIPLSNGHLKSGIIVDKIKDDCFLVDRIESLEHLSSIESLLLSNLKKVEFFQINHNYRFLSYQDASQKPSVIDINGYFGKKLEKVTFEKFFQKLTNIKSSINVKEIPASIIIPQNTSEIPVFIKRRFNIKKL